MIKIYEKFYTSNLFLMVLEGFKLVYLEDFERFLKKIDDDPVAKELLKLANKDNKDIDINYIDNSSKKGFLEYKPDTKITQRIRDYYMEYGWGTEQDRRNRADREVNSQEYRNDFGTNTDGKTVESKIGRTLQKILTLSDMEFTPADIERVVNKIIALQEEELGSIWEIHKGREILDCYNTSNYTRMGVPGNTLDQSCMNDEDDSFFELYMKNPKVCSILTLNDKEGRIVGRSLLWNATKPDIKIMDRVYTIKDSYEMMFNNWAKDNGYVRLNYETFLDTDGKKLQIYPEIQLEESKFLKYPYLDTFKNLDRGKNIISNYERDSNITLNCTDGTYNGHDDYKIVFTLTGKEVSEIDCIKSNYHESYIEKKNALEIYERRIINKGRINTYTKTIEDGTVDYEISDYVDKNEVNITEEKKLHTDVVYSKRDNVHFFTEESEWSDFYKSYIYRYSNDYIYNHDINDCCYKEDEKEFKKHYNIKDEDVQ